MKNIIEIYDSIKKKFKDLTKINVSEGSVIDSMLIAVGYGIKGAYDEIDKNKTPHLYSSLTGSRIDDFGVLVGCVRKEGEDDNSYLFRAINWNTNNQASNKTAIEIATMDMKYASNVKYVPFTHGVGTGTAYVIPKSLDNETSNLALKEAKDKISAVTSASAYTSYVIPKIKKIKIEAYVSFFKDSENSKRNISSKTTDYINNIAPGESLSIGEINKIGVNEINAEYFSISAIFINDKEVQEISLMQTYESKFVFDEILWKEIEK